MRENPNETSASRGGGKPKGASTVRGRKFRGGREVRTPRTSLHPSLLRSYWVPAERPCASCDSVGLHGAIRRSPHLIVPLCKRSLEAAVGGQHLVAPPISGTAFEGSLRFPQTGLAWGHALKVKINGRIVDAVRRIPRGKGDFIGGPPCHGGGQSNVASRGQSLGKSPGKPWLGNDDVREILHLLHLAMFADQCEDGG